MANDKTETGSQQESADRRAQRAAPGTDGMIRTETYEGPDRRSYRARQAERIRNEKIRFFNRTTLSVGGLGAAVVYAVIFLLAPEMKEINDNAARVKEMTARMEALNRQIAASQPVSTVGGTLSRKIGAVEEAVDQATGAVKNVASAVAAAAAPAAGIEDLLQLLTGVQTMGRTKEGRATLAAAVAQLKTAVGLAGEDPENINAAIAVARNQDPTLKSLFGTISDDRLGAAALLLSLDDLRRRIARQEPFLDDLTLAATLTRNDPVIRSALANLLPYAGSGIAGKGALIRQLAELSSATTAVDTPESDGSLKGEALQRLSQYVKVRKTDESQVNGSAATLVRAQAALDSGDVRTALAEVQALQGSSALAAAPWVLAAKGYVAADESSDILSQTILQTLTTMAAGGGFSLENLVATLKTNFIPPGTPGVGNILSVPGTGTSSVPYVSPALLNKEGGKGPEGLQQMPAFGADR